MRKRKKITRPTLLPKQSKCVFKGVLFDMYHWKQAMYDGSEQTFEMLKRPDTVVIIPTTKDEKILIIGDSQPHREEVLSFPGGRMDFDDPYRESIRELEEETGYTTDNLSLWKTIRPSHKMDYLVYYFIAHNCHKKHRPRPDYAGEKIQLNFVSFNKLLKLFIERTFRKTEISDEFIRAFYDKAIKRSLYRKLFNM